MPWWAVGFSLYATGTSAISFMAIPAKSYATNWLYLAENAVGLLAIIPVALIIVPLIRRLNITSTYEYLEMRFHVVIRLMGSVLAIIYQLGARMSVVLFLPALALSAVTGIGVVTSILFMGLIATVYTVLGGIKAVIWTDVVQVVVLLGGALLCLVIIILNVDGGVGGLLEVAAADQKMHMFDWRFDLTIPTVWLFLILATANNLTWPRDQVMVQRVLSTKSAKEAGWSVWTLALIVIPGSVLFFSLGTALYGFYKINPERLSPLLNLDATFPFFIAAELPAGVAGLIIAALFAASMSTLDSSMNSVATIIVVDFYKRFKKSVSDEAALRVAKIITIATGVFGTLFALVLSRYSLPSLWDTFIMLTGLLGGGFGGVYALGMFTRRANWQGALVGIVCSILVTLAFKQYTNIHVLMYGGVAIFSCIIIGYLVSLLFPIQEGHLEGLTVFAKDNTKRTG
jgi:SSS family transporter